MIRGQVPQTRLYKKQYDFHAATAKALEPDHPKIIGFCGGRGTGKTKVATIDRLIRARRDESHMVISPTWIDIHDTTYPAFRETAQELNLWVSGRKTPIPEATVRTRDGGTANFVFRSADNPERLRGPNRASLWYDEPSVISKEAFDIGVPMCRFRRPGQPRGEMGPILLTFTPRGYKHWTFGTFYNRINGVNIPKANAVLIQARTADNPFLPEEFYRNVKDLYSSALAAQELEGQFVDLGGLMFAREWFEVVGEVPRIAQRIRYWDKAGTAASDNPAAAYTAGVLMAHDQRTGLFYIEDVVRGQWSAREREQVMLNTARSDAEKYGNTVLIYVEQEGGSGGKESMENTIRKLIGFPIHRDVVSGSGYRVKGKERLPGEAKIIRAQPWNAQAEAGNIKVKQAPWNSDYLDEVCAFPEFAFMDQVDATSGAFNKLAKMAGIGMDPVKPLETPHANYRGISVMRSGDSRNRIRDNLQGSWRGRN